MSECHRSWRTSTCGRLRWSQPFSWLPIVLGHTHSVVGSLVLDIQNPFFISCVLRLKIEFHSWLPFAGEGDGVANLPFQLVHDVRVYVAQCLVLDLLKDPEQAPI